MDFPSWGPPMLAVVAALLLFMSLSRMAAKAIAEKAAVRGKRVVRVRRQWSRGYFVEGLTLLGLVYRVTTVSDDDGKATVRLYAYDPGQWFSRTRTNLRQFSGGVWRNA